MLEKPKEELKPESQSAPEAPKEETKPEVIVRDSEVAKKNEFHEPKEVKVVDAPVAKEEKIAEQNPFKKS